MGFMEIESFYGAGVEVETGFGTFYLPEDIAGTVKRETENPKVLARFTDYVEGKPVRVAPILGGWARYSAPGYMDCTDWTFNTDGEDEARRECIATYGTGDECAECGAELDDDGELCEECRDDDTES